MGLLREASLSDVLEKDSTPHLTTRQEKTVKLLESHKAPFRRYPEYFLCLVGLSPYYPFDENSYLAFEYPDESEIGLFDFIKTADPRKVQAIEVQKGDNQVKLLESTRDCFMSLVIPVAGGSSSAAVVEVSAPTEEGRKDVALEDAYLELADPDEGTTAVRQSEEEVVTKQPKKVTKKRLVKQSDVIPAKKLRIDHPTLASGTGGKTLAGLEQIRPVGSRLPTRERLAFPSVAYSSQESESLLDSSVETNLWIRTTVESSSTLGILVDTTAAATTSTRAVATTKFATDNDGFSCHTTLVDRVAPTTFFSSLRTMDYDQLYMKFNVGAVRQVCLGAEVAGGERFRDPQVEVPTGGEEGAEVIRLRDQVSSLSREKSALTAEVSALKVTVTQKDHDISLLNSRATCLESTLDDAKVAFAEAGNKITSLASE
ncbi:hypothetical protein Tco_1379871 [Tanacetum coccineum]